MFFTAQMSETLQMGALLIYKEILVVENAVGMVTVGVTAGRQMAVGKYLGGKEWVGSGAENAESYGAKNQEIVGNVSVAE